MPQYKHVNLGLLLVFTAGCNFADQASVTALPGTYETAATWDLSGPFAQNRSFGENTADLFISYMVGQLGAPASVNLEIESAVADLVHEPLSTLIDVNAPEEFASSGLINQALSQDLATIQLTSQLDLQHESNEVEEVVGLNRIVGTEQIQTLSIESAVGNLAVPLDSVADSNSMEASSFSTSVSNDEMVISEQVHKLNYGKLVQYTVEESLGLDNDDLNQDVSNAVDCGSLVDSFLGDIGTPEVTVAGQTYTFDTNVITNGCSNLSASLSERPLGIFDTSMDVVIAGPTLLRYTEDATEVYAIESADGYTGSLRGLPGGMSPTVDLSFAATRIGE
ncbi:MAG: hypothetical protein VX278_06625 [Myxococcota bacterium]|nr:hypothetical protein [Myxococcota bacterium]